LIKGEKWKERKYGKGWVRGNEAKNGLGSSALEKPVDQMNEAFMLYYASIQQIVEERKKINKMTMD